MKKQSLFLFLIITFCVFNSSAQDTLPNFSLNNIGNNRIIVSWTNTLPNVVQIGIQRSFDSLSGYKTILTVLDPTLPQNGFADVTAANDNMFYRLYIQQDQGIYQFSKSKRPVKEIPIKIVATEKNETNPYMGDSAKPANPFIVKLGGFPGKDTVAVPNPVTIKNRPPGYLASVYVFTYRDGNVQINLPDDEKPKKYIIKFFDEEGNLLFELKDIKEKKFKIDKSNFFHAGWFKFELSEDGKLIEKNKFYLEKDF